MTKYVMTIKNVDPEEVFTKLKGLENIVVLESTKSNDKSGFAFIESYDSIKAIRTKLGYAEEYLGIGKVVKYKLAETK